jgi:hypothetical protein
MIQPWAAISDFETAMMAESPRNNRRNYRRYDLENENHLFHGCLENGEKLSAEIDNVSINGLLLSCSGNLERFLPFLRTEVRLQTLAGYPAEGISARIIRVSKSDRKDYFRIGMEMLEGGKAVLWNRLVVTFLISLRSEKGYRLDA